MRSRVVGCLAACLVAGCGFHPTTALEDGQPSDSKLIDASTVDASDAAKTFQDAAAVTSTLTVSVTTLGAADLDLTAEGTIDWAHWGYLSATGFDHKTGGNAISDVSTSPALGFTGAPFTATWSDGSPHPSVAMTSSGAGIHEGSTLTFTVAADPTLRTLRLYVGAQDAEARLDVSLDGATPQTRMLSSTNGTTNVLYTITFTAAAGERVTVSWTDTNDSNGNPFAALLEATLH